MRSHFIVCVVAIVMLAGCESAAPSVRCGVGTTLNGRECTVSGAACSAGTRLENGVCVAGAEGLSKTCGAGTAEVNGVCTAELEQCGTGTTRVERRCVAAIERCGSGTRAQGVECVADALRCGAGTAQVGTECRVDLSKVCGADTVAAQGTSCVGRVMCGDGTVRQADQCRPNLSALCAQGTISSGGRCQLDGATACGTGTVLSSAQCRPVTPSPSLQTFAAATTLKLGYRQTPLLNGGAIHRLVVTDLSQASADGWAASTAALTGTGAAVHSIFEGPLLALNASVTRAIRPESNCLTAAPHTVNSSGPRASFYGWSLGTSRPLTCALGGSVKVERLLLGGVDSVRITYDVQFADGTVWADRVFTGPFS